jgi:hypothetical protein
VHVQLPTPLLNPEAADVASLVLRDADLARRPVDLGELVSRHPEECLGFFGPLPKLIEDHPEEEAALSVPRPSVLHIRRLPMRRRLWMPAKNTFGGQG